MNRKMKEMLREAFEAPAPVHRQEFLSGVPRRRVSTFSFMLSQAGYIRKWPLVLSLFVLALSLVGACFLKLDMLWAISAFLPFVALSAVAESARSATYGMDELEMSSRFSLKMVVLARMGILGVLHLLLVCFLLPLAYINSIFSVLQAGVYMLTPYLMTDAVSLWLIRKVRGRDGLYSCLGVAVCISFLYSVLREQLVNILYRSYFGWPAAALIGLLVLCGTEMKKMVRMTEV